jgi:hypothetical protein
VKPKLITIGLLSVLISRASAANSFDIDLNYTGDMSYLPMFQTAEAIWEEIIPSYIDGNQGVAVFTGLQINASISSIDGIGGVLGSAGPLTGGYDDSGYLLAVSGQMQFDVDDVAGLGADLVTVILHEMAHVIGIGTLWDWNGLYVDGSGQYTGAEGLAAYQAEFNQPGATFVPVELGGGGGTADGHWDEVNGGIGATGRFSSVFGQDMQYEIMTGWLNTDQPYFISNLTRASLRDLGYNVALVPETSTSALGAIGIAVLASRRRRR